MLTFILSLFFIGAISLLLAFDGLRRLLGILLASRHSQSSVRRKEALIGGIELTIAIAAVAGSALVILTQPIFGPSFLTTYSEVTKFMNTRYPEIEITDFSLSEAPDQDNAYAIKAGTSSRMIKILVTFDPVSKAITEIKTQEP